MAGSAKPARVSRSLGFYLYLIPGGLGLLAVVLVPLLANIAISFTSWKGIGAMKFVGLSNYQKLLADDLFWGSLQHTAVFIFAVAIVPTIIGLVVAAVLFDFVSASFSPAVSNFFRAGFYLPQILPISAAGVLWGWILSPVGVANSVLGSLGLGGLQQNWLGNPTIAILSVSGVLVWLQVGYSLVVFMAGLTRVDPALYEAAEIDGATWTQRFWSVTVPMLQPEIFVVGLTTTIAALKVFAPVYVLTTAGPDNATMVPSYLSFYHFFSTNRIGYGSAITTAQTLLTFVLAFFFVRFQLRRTGDE
jgi:raffinose/stachyose/melibiose transport system permease protein